MKKITWCSYIGFAACVLLAGCSKQTTQPTIIEIPQEGVIINETTITEAELNEIIGNIEWTFVEDEWMESTTAVGVLENTTTHAIDYLELEYKLIKDGITVESSCTGLINIEPGEKMVVEIYTVKDFDSLQVKGTVSVYY